MKTKLLNKIIQEPIHLVFFSILPFLILVSSNISEINLSSTIRFGIGSFLLGTLLFLLLSLRAKNRFTIALLLTFSLITFFSYGHLYDFLRHAFTGLTSLVRHRYLLPLTLLFYIAGITLIIKSVSNNSAIQIQSALNWIGCVLVLFNISNIAIYEYQESTIKSTFSAPGTLRDKSSKSMPDVYFIVLDSYTREDVFLSFFDYDNSNFLQELRDLGFYIPPCSQSNYSYTIASVSSTLNMNYLDQFDIEVPADPSSFLPYQKHFQNSLVKKRFQEAGYKIVTSDSEFPWLVWKDADVVFKLPSQNGISEKLQPFEIMYLQTTALRYIIDQNPKATNVANKNTKYKIANYQIERLKTISEDVSSPKFLFINLEVTHPPFVFNEDGSINTETGFTDNLKFTDYPQFKADYVKSVKFINKQMLEIVHNIIANSNTPPIIIIQGDHGFRNMDYTNMNLEAFLIPGAEAYYYPTISPVNTFRVVENMLFENNLSLLPDLHYLRPGEDYYSFKQIFETMPGCKK